MLLSYCDTRKWKCLKWNNNNWLIDVFCKSSAARPPQPNYISDLLQFFFFSDVTVSLNVLHCFPDINWQLKKLPGEWAQEWQNSYARRSVGISVV